MAYTTNHTLLQKMRQGDENSWELFREFYRPLIARRGLDYRLSKDEIDILIQDVLVVCFRERVLENYDRTKGKFRDYLRTVVSRHANKLIASRSKAAELPEWVEIPDDSLEEAEERTWHNFLKDRALQELSQSMDSLKYMAFDMYELQGKPAAEVAEILGMSTNQVYLIASRTVKHMKEIVERLDRDLNI